MTGPQQTRGVAVSGASAVESDATPGIPAAVTVTPLRAGLALGVLLAAMFMSLLDATIVNVALPTIRTSLGASETTLMWVISGYALASGLALIPAGRMGDRFGHKWVFFTGLAVFTLGSVLCSLAQDDAGLIIGRVTQGLGGGIFLPAVAPFIQLLFAPQRRGRAFAIMGGVIGASSALGPILGGSIIQVIGEETGWRWIFAVNAPVGILALIGAALLLPSGTVGKKLSTDVVGLVLLSASLVALLVPLIQGRGAGWPMWTFVSIAASVVLMVLFALRERNVAARGREPLVPPHLYSHPSFTGGTILALVFFAAFTSIFFTVSILWQAGMGRSALEAGLVSVPFAVGNIVGAALSDRLAQRIGRTVLVIGSGLFLVGLVALFLIVLIVPTAELTGWELLGPLLVAGFGSGLFIAPNARFIVTKVDRAEGGAASGVIGTMRRLGSAVGVAVVGSVLFGSIGTMTGPQATAAAFGQAAALALAVSAVFAFAAFALVFTLRNRVAL